MSQLIDKLNQVSGAISQSMGFRTVKSASAKSKMLLITSLPQTENIDNLAGYVTGADAVLLHIAKSSSETENIQKIARSLPDVPWGAWLGDTGKKGTGTLGEAGGDFIVFPATSKVLAAPQDDKTGKILQIDSSLNEGLVKTINKLPVDAILTASEPGGEQPLTWHHLMVFQRLASLLTKPLLASISLKATASEIKSLWEAGVNGVVVEMSAGQPVKRLGELRQAIDDLALLPPRQRSKAEALLPHIGLGADTVTEDEEEEE